ncbi:MAG: biopolymer transporter ExbD [bacterium]
MPKIERSQKTEAVVPTASMADIAFLLLIFFMVTTVFVVYRGIRVERPRAEQVERIEKKKLLTYMWIAEDGQMMINDHRVEMDGIQSVIYPIRVDEPNMIVSIIADVRAPYGTVSDAMRQLREVDALKVNFAAMQQR